MVSSAKYAHYLLGVGDKVKESSKSKYVILLEKIEDVAKNLDFKSSEYRRSMISKCNCTSSQSTSKGEEKILKIGVYFSCLQSD